MGNHWLILLGNHGFSQNRSLQISPCLPSIHRLVANAWFHRSTRSRMAGQMPSASQRLIGDGRPLRINGLLRSRARERRYQDRWEKCKARLRAKVEHAFRGIKRQFGYTKVGSRGLAKNAAQGASKDPTVNACTESFGPVRCHPRDRHGLIRRKACLPALEQSSASDAKRMTTGLPGQDARPRIRRSG